MSFVQMAYGNNTPTTIHIRISRMTIGDKRIPHIPTTGHHTLEGTAVESATCVRLWNKVVPMSMGYFVSSAKPEFLSDVTPSRDHQHC